MTALEASDVPADDAGEFDAAELGNLLKETRTALQRDLAHVASELRIRLVYLQAIEDGRLDDLPGPAYATGFLRAYGDFLGLDGEDLVYKFKASGGVGNRRMDLQLPSPVEEGRLPTGSILLVAALLAAGAYGGWYYLSSQGRDPLDYVAELPGRVASFSEFGGESLAAGQPQTSTEQQISEASASDGEKTPDDAANAPAAAETTPAPTSSSAPATPRPKAVVEPARAAEVVPVPKVPEAPKVAREVLKAPPGVPVPDRRVTARVASAAANRRPPAPTPPKPPVAPERPVARIAPERLVTVVPIPPPESTDSLSPAPADEIVGGSEGEDSAVQPDPTPSRPTPSSAQSASAQPAADAAPSNGAGPVVASFDGMAAGGAPHKIVLRATADSWVEVRADNETPLLSRVMRVGESFEVPARAGLKMATGNAGGIEIVIDGVAITRLGPIGAVRRDVALDARSLLVRGTAAR